ncbi:MAG: HD domain-containing protein [Chloroflexota bacterium]|nr:HD domain-containing protein [Chloroflexota bacterium]
MTSNIGRRIVPGGCLLPEGMDTQAKIKELAYIFRKQGKALYLVGGGVRDRLRGCAVEDYDLATDATPEETKHLAAAARPEGLYTVGEKFGTVGLIFSGHRVEITTFRSEAYLPRSRWPQVAFGTSLEDDLGRRDFTINALAQDILGGQIIDLYGGRTDLERGIIRAVGEPQRRFEEDPLRLLRAIRFASQLGFSIEEGTAQAIATQAELLGQVSVERIAEEMTKTLIAPYPARGLRFACQLGLIAHVIPELVSMKGLAQDAWHHKDVFEHTLAVVERIAPESTLRWAALLHDIGKPSTLAVEGDEVHFFGHEVVGAAMARSILLRLRLDRRTVKLVTKLVRMHMRINLYDGQWSDSAVRRFMREAEAELPLLFALSRADVTSYRPARVRAALANMAELEKRCQQIEAASDVAQIKSPLDGNDLMVLFGIGPGPWIKPIKEHLLQEVLEGRLAQDDKEKAGEMAKAFFAKVG